jgi:hypothetical protein
MTDRPKARPPAAETDNVWNFHHGVYMPGTRATQQPTIPPGLYRFVQTPMGWYLEPIAPRFTFPFKVYGKDERIVARTLKAFEQIPGNLGIMLNGLKGTGKSVALQLICNAVIDKGIPVIVASDPIPLGSVIEHAIAQEVCVAFDEFEKTHAKKEEQQAILTAIDGMSRGPCKRLFLFTTNTLAIDENLVDRPSRVRYRWEFGRLSNELIEELMDDLLDPELFHLRGDIAAWLAARQVLSIDVVKALLMEVNTFREPPNEFEAFINMSEKYPGSYRLTRLLDDGSEELLFGAFLPGQESDRNTIRKMLTPSGHKTMKAELEKLVHAGRDPGHWFRDDPMKTYLRVLEATGDPAVWICEYGMPIWKTWACPDGNRKLENYHNAEWAWLDEKPEGWAPPDWAVRFREGRPEETDRLMVDRWSATNTVYGTGVRAKIRIRIEPVQEKSTLKYASAFQFGAGPVGAAK